MVVFNGLQSVTEHDPLNALLGGLITSCLDQFVQLISQYICTFSCKIETSDRESFRFLILAKRETSTREVERGSSLGSTQTKILEQFLRLIVEECCS